MCESARESRRVRADFIRGFIVYSQAPEPFLHERKSSNYRPVLIADLSNRVGQGRVTAYTGIRMGKDKRERKMKPEGCSIISIEQPERMRWGVARGWAFENGCERVVWQLTQYYLVVAECAGNPSVKLTLSLASTCHVIYYDTPQRLTL